jgi:peptide/nickel transport system permease protein
LGRLAAGLLAVSFLFFVLPGRLPGGTAAGFLGPNVADPAARTALQRDIHLDRSAPLRFVLFLSDAAHGDLGHSPVSGVDVGAVVGERLAESLALATAASAVAFVLTRRRRRASRRRSRDDTPAPSALPGALWLLPLFSAVMIAVRFGVVPAPAAHAAVVSRIGASLLPAATLGIGLAFWTTVARRTMRDLLAAVLVGTVVTEAVFGLPGLGTLLRDAATRPDPMMLRGTLYVLSVVAVVAAVVLVPAAGLPGDVSGGPSNRRRAARGTVATLWVLLLVAATVGRVHVGLPAAGRIGTHLGDGPSAAHPFGTDILGRDMLARVLATARGSLLLVVAAMLIATVVGTAIGVVAGFVGGRLERLFLAALSGWAAFPSELLALALLAFNGRGGTQTALALSVVALPSIAFGAQRRTLAALRRADARLGSGPWLRSVGSGATPGLLRATLATVFVGAARVVVTELVAGLVGLGPVATQTWSHEIALQLAFAARAPWAVLAPVAVAIVTAGALAGLGNAIRPPRPV